MRVEDGTTLLVTGGRGALGSALAMVAGEEGWVVHAPGRGELDVRDEGMVERVIGGMARLDLLVCAAGMRRDGLVAGMSEATFAEVLEVNLRGAFLSARAAAAVMARVGRGHIVFVGSHSAVTGPVGQSAYAAAKAGLAGMTRALAEELGGLGIRVNCVLPGWMETAFTAGVAEPVREAARRASVLRRVNEPEEVARAILGLHGMRGVSGQVMALDGRPLRVF